MVPDRYIGFGDNGETLGYWIPSRDGSLRLEIGTSVDSFEMFVGVSFLSTLFILGIGVCWRLWSLTNSGRNVLGLLEEEANQHKVDPKEECSPPPHPSPALVSNYESSSHRAPKCPETLHHEKESVKSGMLVNKKEVHNGYHDNCFAGHTSNAREQIGYNELPTGVKGGRPNRCNQLDQGAHHIKWSPAVFVYNRNKEQAADCKAGTVRSHCFIEGFVRDAQLRHVRLKRDFENVQHHKCEEDVEAGEAEVDSLAPRRPVQGVIGIIRGPGTQDGWCYVLYTEAWSIDNSIIIIVAFRLEASLTLRNHDSSWWYRNLVPASFCPVFMMIFLFHCASTAWGMNDETVSAGQLPNYSTNFC